MAQMNLLLRVLDLARREKALEGDALEAFTAALQERAGLIVEERAGRLEDRIRSLEEQVGSLAAENEWRRELVAGLEETVRALDKERAWLRETAAGLQDELRETVATMQAGLDALEKEREWLRETAARREEEITALRAERDEARTAHERLLAHHRDVVRQVTGEVSGVASLSVLRVRQARQRLQALADLLGRELP